MTEERVRVEKALLCALFLDKVVILDVVSLLRPEMFSDPDYAFVYEAFVDLYNRGVEPDMILVDAEMGKKDPDRFRKMGGLACISDGMEEVRLEHNALEYAREIRRSFMLNCLSREFKRLALACQASDADYRMVMEDCGKTLLKLREDNSETDSLMALSEVGEMAIRDQEERLKHKDDPARFLTGIYGIDGLSGGLYRKEVMVIGGLSSDGKTALSSFIAMNIAKQGKHVLHFSFEMTGEQTMSRFFSGYAGVEADRLRIGGLRDTDLEKMRRYVEQFRNLNYSFVNVPSMSLEALRAEIHRKSSKGECDFILIDYLHTLAQYQGKNETLESVIRSTITALRSYAVEFNCAMVVVSQLNREIFKRNEKCPVPLMSDLRDSGAIEYTADNVIIINRPARFGAKVTDDGRSTAGLLRLYLLKNRCGAPGVVDVYHNKTFTYFTNPDETFPFAD